MFALLMRLTARALHIAENPLYISPPRKKLLLLMGGTVIALSAFLCVTVTIKLSIIVTAPFIVALGYVFIMLSRIWCAYKYSLFYPVASAVLIASLVFLCKYLTFIY